MSKDKPAAAPAAVEEQPAPAVELVPLPSLGRQVFYRAWGTTDDGRPTPVLRPATVIGVADPENPASLLDLNVHLPGQLVYVHRAPMGEAPNCWSWPPFVAPVERPVKA